MKFLYTTFFSLIFCSATFGKPYAVINDVGEVNGCMHYTVTIWEDGGTPHDTSDDQEMASATLNDCIDKPSANVDGDDDGNTSVGTHALVPKYYHAENTDGQACTFYLVQILDDEETVVAEQTMFGFCE